MKLTTTLLTVALATLSTTAPLPVDTNATDGVKVDSGVGGMATWVSQDGLNRAIHCTPSPPHAELPDIDLPAGQSVTSQFPQGWIGNCWGVIEGEENKGTGMLAEFAWNAWEDMNYFDVSAIVEPQDNHNVKMMVPAVGDTPVSGCQNVEPGQCDKLYVLPDDVQTRVTEENHLIVYVGDAVDNVAEPVLTKRDTPVARAYIIGEKS